MYLITSINISAFHLAAVNNTYWLFILARFDRAFKGNG